jgi:hypothetical protein
MQAIRTQIVARLQSDQTLYPNLVPGGVWDRPLAAGTGRGSTPAAFWIDPADPTKTPRLRRSLVVLDGGEVAAVGGPSTARETFPRIFYYVPATASDKTALDDIDSRVLWLLDPANWRPTVGANRPLVLSALELSELVESEQFPGSLVCFRRFRGEYLKG